MFTDLYFCDRCSGYGIWLTPRNEVSECPNYRLKRNGHPAPNAAADRVLSRAKRIAADGKSILTRDFYVARALTRGTSSQPIERDRLVREYFAGAGSNATRIFHSVIETLRAHWLLPVASRKDAPHGYWISTEVNDFREWVERAKSAPVKQLTTIHAVAKANFPVFAEQLELEFWSNLSPDTVAGVGQAATPKSTS